VAGGTQAGPAPRRPADRARRVPGTAQLPHRHTGGRRAPRPHCGATRGRIELEEGHILGVHGLSRQATGHRIEHDSGGVNTSCGRDAIGMPAALAITARGRPHCPTCGRELTVTLTGGDPEPLPRRGVSAPAPTSLLPRPPPTPGGENAAAGTLMTVDQVADVGGEAWREVSADADGSPAAARGAAVLGGRTETRVGERVLPLCDRRSGALAGSGCFR
jgi:hypothetical protein